MKQTAYWMMAAIAVGLLITGCDKSKADAQKKSEAPTAIPPSAALDQPPAAGAAAGTLVALGAARLGSTRLIDNLEF